MKCQQCGTSNGKTNKFCRECGASLGEAVESLLPPENAEPDVLAAQEKIAPVDEVAIGEELFRIMKLYESEALDEALARADAVARLKPDSVSAFSLLSLIHERKADRAKSAGEADSYRELLRTAIIYQERVIDINPGSAADRQKLAMLRMKLTGQPQRSKPTVAKAELAQILKKVPVPVLAASATFLMIIIVSLIMMAFTSGRSHQKETSRLAAQPEPATMNVPAAPSMPTAPPVAAPNAYQPAAPVNQPEPQETEAAPEMTPPAPPSIGISVAPTNRAKPPKIQPILPNVTIVPAAGSKPMQIPKLPGDSVPSSKPAQQPTPAPKSQVNGSVLLATATQQYEARNYDDAITSAEQAITLFQADIDAGKNVDSARRGVSNAQRLISVARSQPSSEGSQQ